MKLATNIYPVCARTVKVFKVRDQRLRLLGLHLWEICGRALSLVTRGI